MLAAFGASDALDHAKEIAAKTPPNSLVVTLAAPQPGEEWAIQNVRIGLQSLIEKLEEGVQ